MNSIWVVLAVVVMLIWKFIFLPYSVDKNIRKYIESMNGEVIKIQNLSIRDSIYLVEYKVNDQLIRRNTKCNFLGHITQWI